jgi:hypothetical protein
MIGTGRSAWPTIGIWSAFLLLWLGAGWPGWLSPDSVEMMRQAQGLEPVTDWHSPLLTFAWTWLSPRTLGPIGPFIIQVVCVWSGLLLVALWIYDRSMHRAWLLFPAALVVRAIWVSHWIWKDAAALALVSLTLGVAVTAMGRPNGRAARCCLILVPCLLAAAASIRCYMFPALALGSVATVVLIAATDSMRRLRNALVTNLTVFAVTTTVLLSFQTFVIRPGPAYVPAISLMFDLARVECAVGTAADRSAGRSRFPPTALVTIPGDDLCGHFNPWIHDPLLYPLDADTQSHDRLPGNAREMADLESAWWNTAREHPAIVLLGRSKLFLKLLLQADIPYVPLPTSSINNSVSGWAAPGVGGDHGWPGRGGVPLAFAVAPALLIATASGLWIVVLPAMMMLLIRRRRPALLRRVGLLLAFPICWAANIAVVAPAAEARFVAPAAIWGFLGILIAAALLEDGTGT